MDGHKVQDKIDVELTKAYFGNPEVKNKPESSEPQKSSPKEGSPSKNEKKLPKSKPTFTVIVILFAILFSAAYFIKQAPSDLEAATDVGSVTEIEPIVKLESVVEIELPIEPEPVVINIEPAVKPGPIIEPAPAIRNIVIDPNTGIFPPEDASNTTTIVHEKPAAEKTAEKTPLAAMAKTPIITSDKVLYTFEKDDEGWEIPLWAIDKPDHVAESAERSLEISSEGDWSLRFDVSFPGGIWSAALLEIQHFLDLDGYNTISADIYLPPDCRDGLRGKLILTVGDAWRFVEMSRGVRIKPGGWTTITADLSNDSTDWKRTKVDSDFRQDIRKVAIRIESNIKPIYFGPIYLDNVRISK